MFRQFIQRSLHSRVRSRFFDQVEHETVYASSGNKHFYTKSGHWWFSVGICKYKPGYKSHDL